MLNPRLSKADESGQKGNSCLKSLEHLCSSIARRTVNHSSHVDKTNSQSRKKSKHRLEFGQTTTDGGDWACCMRSVCKEAKRAHLCDIKAAREDICGNQNSGGATADLGDDTVTGSLSRPAERR